MDCFNCEECCPIGEGDHICLKTNRIVICEYTPTDEFGKCKEEKEIK